MPRSKCAARAFSNASLLLRREFAAKTSKSSKKVTPDTAAKGRVQDLVEALTPKEKVKLSDEELAEASVRWVDLNLCSECRVLFGNIVPFHE